VNGDRLTAMTAEELLRDLRDRISANNYDEARNVAQALLARLGGMGDAILKAHIAGQEVGEKRLAPLLREAQAALREWDERPYIAELVGRIDAAL